MFKTRPKDTNNHINDKSGCVISLGVNSASPGVQLHPHFAQSSNHLFAL